MADRKAPTPPPGEPGYRGPAQVKPAPPAAPPLLASPPQRETTAMTDSRRIARATVLRIVGGNDAAEDIIEAAVNAAITETLFYERAAHDTQQQAALRKALTNEVVRAIGSLARQTNVCREQDGQAVFVTGIEAAREYLIEQLRAAQFLAEPGDGK